MTRSSDIVLYNYFRSSVSYRVRIALQLKNLPYEYRSVRLAVDGGEQYGAEYAKLNPAREIPTLVHDGRVIGQSIAILDYLDAIAPEPRLFPVAQPDRAHVLQACEIINSGAHPPGNLRVQKLLMEAFGATESQKEAWTKFWIRWGLESLEAFLKPHAGKYSFGDTLTASDCFLAPHMFIADRFEVSTAAYPTLMRIARNCGEIEAFDKASPSRQPDSPKL